MNEDQGQKCHTCRFCKQSFFNGRQLGGHMRRHLALIAATRQMGNHQITQENINHEKGIDVFTKDDQIVEETDQEKCVVINDVMVKKSQQEVDMDVDQDCKGNVYVLRENPKRSWRVSNSSKGFGKFVKKKCDSRKGLMKECVCEKCGKSFGSMKALYGHMRCHSIKRSKVFDEPCLMSSSMEYYDHGDGDGGEVATLVRKKRSCTRYKSPKPNDDCSDLSFFYDEVEEGAICLMMLSMGVRDLDEVKMVISSHAKLVTHESKNVEFEVSLDGSMEFCGLKDKSKVGSRQDLIFESGSGQVDSGWAGSTKVKYKSSKKPRLIDQDFGDMDASDCDMLKRRSKDYNCPICLKEFGSGRALGCHKRVHITSKRKVGDKNHVGDVHRVVNNNPDPDFLREVSTMMLWGP